MKNGSDLDLAHKLGLELLQTIREYWSLCSLLQLGMPPDDPRLEEITRIRAKLRVGIRRAEAGLTPHLPEFARAHFWPVIASGLTASSAHKATLQWAVRLRKRLWTKARFRKLFKKYYVGGQVNWDAVRADNDKTDDGMREFWLRQDWSKHEALLELEYAHATNAGRCVDALEFPQIETDIKEALGDDTLFGRELARKAGYPYNTNFKQRLARMVEGGRLTNWGKGYRNL